MIASAKLSQEGDEFVVTLDDGTELHVPDDLTNSHRRNLQVWIDGGGMVDPADVIAKPTDAERADAEIANSVALTGLVRELANRFGITEQQMIDALKTKLP